MSYHDFSSKYLQSQSGNKPQNELILSVSSSFSFDKKLGVFTISYLRVICFRAQYTCSNQLNLENIRSMTTKLTFSDVEKTPYGRFWIGKWLSGDTCMKDMLTWIATCKCIFRRCLKFLISNLQVVKFTIFPRYFLKHFFYNKKKIYLNIEKLKEWIYIC